MNVAGGFHLTYCSNIHKGETWREVSDALADSLPRVRHALGFDGPLAIGLRLSAAVARTLEVPATLDRFRDFLRLGNYYVMTINGFPYGAFHGQRVKEQVYLPDWRDAARLEYTNRLARLLAGLLLDRPGIVGSVSTVPGAFRPHIRSHADVGAIAKGILRHAAFLASLRAETGVTITLALEPEPACYLETIDDAIAFFHRYLFDPARVETAAHEAGTALTVDDVRQHIGVCFDTCHMAVEFEDPATAMRRLLNAGLRICKIQVSSALRVPPAADAARLRAALVPFAEDTYLHQVVEHTGTGFVRFTDLPDALSPRRCSDETHQSEWRVHFHVPIFLESLGDFETTQPYVASILDVLKRERVCPYLEVETYTWDVLPAQYRTVDMPTAIARELAWVRDRLES